MPFGEDVYENDGTVYKAGTPGGYGVVEVKRMLQRRAEEKKIPLPTGFNSELFQFGTSASKLCAAVQAGLGLKADGACGPTTMRAGFKIDLWGAATSAGVEFELVCKLISLESGFNPSAYAPGPWPATYANGTRDRGIAQLNSAGGISDDDAFNVLKAFKAASDRLGAALTKFGETDVAIASYNVGTTGAGYYRAGRDYWKVFQGQVC